MIFPMCVAHIKEPLCSRRCCIPNLQEPEGAGSEPETKSSGIAQMPNADNLRLKNHFLFINSGFWVPAFERRQHEVDFFYIGLRTTVHATVLVEKFPFCLVHLHSTTV